MARSAQFKSQISRNERVSLAKQVLSRTWPKRHVFYSVSRLLFKRHELDRLSDGQDLIVIHAEPTDYSAKQGYEAGLYIFTLTEYQDQLGPVDI